MHTLRVMKMFKKSVMINLHDQVAGFVDPQQIVYHDKRHAGAATTHLDMFGTRI